jgi:hypothetical protein
LSRPGERFHTDLFLTQNALSLGRKPRGPEGALAFRGLLLGVQFFLRVEKHLALGIDVAYQRMELSSASALVSSPDFVTAVIAAQIRP